jgi:putative Mg2+ transporter-C (MgtC) family protein
MTTDLSVGEVVLRLVLTFVAGAVVGVNRGEHGRPAGLRTTILVCLAASVSMIQANLLLGTGGRSPDSFIMLDLMRLPLGILSGMGFIGAGAILRRGSLVLGVTTAATLWFVTVMGLCFGGGQIGLGLAMLGMAVVVLWGLKWLEKQLEQDRRASLSVSCQGPGLNEHDIRQLLEQHGFRVITWQVTLGRNQSRKMDSMLEWCGKAAGAEAPAFVTALAASPGVVRVSWKA